eukprot:CAMPEP_0113299630 /NCGR_PEP_ID=MMETSP0010_2-20120614/1587_1 /TAXON_ID=216773 ORGANISM="Corethron hystrix, Strain 308" /NCGR_SAMPLE_ID=MMETSP0010_2 /ASSEMBLY_ACC=CAM_ASM_000155 /LENGTH=60 /DNA_ID=CAMNT_0000152901 /DNA_START=1743 /DNA_END=1921 /DNA_ORIENTATION=+ /assembly_acc=CAM_ASM_000155
MGGGDAQNVWRKTGTSRVFRGKAGGGARVVLEEGGGARAFRRRAKAREAFRGGTTAQNVS